MIDCTNYSDSIFKELALCVLENKVIDPKGYVMYILFRIFNNLALKENVVISSFFHKLLYFC